jgi:hypothetical protein
MLHQAHSLIVPVAQVAPSAARTPLASIGRRLSAAWCLGPRPVALWLSDRALRHAGVARARLADSTVPAGRFLPATVPAAPPLQGGASIRDAAKALPPAGDWHGGFDPAAHGLASLRRAAAPGAAGARDIWEASRLAALPLLAQAARLDPGGDHLARAEALLGDWCRRNPPFRGVNWACGQEAAFRAIHLALALALLDADRDPPAAARALLEACARRIAATPFYALAQDNNHPVSEAAGSFVCALLLGRETRRHAARLARRVARLVAADGGFAQVSPGYARALLDTLAIAEWLRRRHAAPAFPAPFRDRAAALTLWLHRLATPDGGTPPLGLEDGAALADLSLCGPGDARGSIERAARLFRDASAGFAADPGCAWLGLRCPEAMLAPAPRWRTVGTAGWKAGRSFALLRTGPLRFRPGQCDLLHLSLRHGASWIIRDGGTGSYDPPAAWWWDALWGAAGHNAPVFDGAEPMPRVGRFLLARWPRVAPLAEGAALRDARGNELRRTVSLGDGSCSVADEIAGPFREVAWHWRLCPGAWRREADGVSGPARIAVTADAPVAVALGSGWESPSYGAIRPVPVLRVSAAAPVSRVITRIVLAA